MEEDKKEKKKQQHIEKKEKDLNDYYLGLCIGLSALFFLFIFILIYYIGIVGYIENRKDVNNENKKKYIIISGIGVFVIYVIGTYFIVDALIKERDRKIAGVKKIATI
jgi:amino acid transporter